MDSGHFLCPDILRWSCGFSLSICNGSSRRLHDVTVSGMLSPSACRLRFVAAAQHTICHIFFLLSFSTALRFRTVQDVNDKLVFITRFAHFLFTFLLYFCGFFSCFFSFIFFFSRNYFVQCKSFHSYKVIR